MAGNPADLLHTYYDALDRRDLDAIEALLAPTCAWTYAQVAVRGPWAVRETLRRTVALIGRTRHDVAGLVQDGDVAMGEVLAQRQIDDQTFTLTETVVCESSVGRIVRLDSYLNPEEARPYFLALREAGRRRRGYGAVGGVPV